MPKILIGFFQVAKSVLVDGALVPLQTNAPLQSSRRFWNVEGTERVTTESTEGISSKEFRMMVTI